MKYNYLIISFSILIIGLNACKSDVKTSNNALSIESLEDSVFTDDGGIRPMQEENAHKLTAAYEAYAASGVADSVAVEALFKAAAVAKNTTSSYAKSIQILNQIYTKYPTSPRAASAEFIEAYTYANDLQDSEKGKQLYEAFLKKYPTHPMAATAQLELQNIGKTAEEMVESFQKK